MLSIRLEPEAENDLLAAWAWYEEQRPGLGHRLVDELDVLFEAIAENPKRFPLKYRGLRQAIAGCFPYVTYYRETPDAVVVLAILHIRRDPEPTLDDR
jgi:plasmid stabilization system protein ParE